MIKLLVIYSAFFLVVGCAGVTPTTTKHPEKTTTQKAPPPWQVAREFASERLDRF